MQIPQRFRTPLLGVVIALSIRVLERTLRPLGLLFFGLFGFWIYWTRCNVRIVLTPQMHAKLQMWLQLAKDHRHNSPFKFCVISCSCLGILFVLGHFISLVMLSLILFEITAFVGRANNLKLLEIERKNNVNTEEDLNEFMPELNTSDILLLEKASTATYTDDDMRYCNTTI